MIKNALEKLSPWWVRSVILIILLCFAVLIWVAISAYENAPPIPQRVVDPSGKTLFTGDDILSGQEVFLKHGLMENGTIWGHGAYLGPDFSAEYLHTLALHAGDVLGKKAFGAPLEKLTPDKRAMANAEVPIELRQNRYDPATGTLRFSESETDSYGRQQTTWKQYFSEVKRNRGLLAGAVSDPVELRQLVSFFAWTAWASVANRPGLDYSYTNNFPYDPLVGNVPTVGAYLWSALSLVVFLAAVALVLFSFGKFGFLGWKGTGEHIHPEMLPGVVTDSQKGTIKFFLVAAVLFLAQVFVGSATAHFRADPTSFYGFDLAQIFPSNLLRTWHLQLAIFWIATAWVAGGLFLASALGGKDPRHQSRGVNLLFAALAIVVFGSLFGEMFGIRQMLGKLWFWFGNQGWEYLDLGRGWQFLLVVGFGLWLWLVIRAVGNARRDREKGEISWLFLLAALAIPLFYVPALFFMARSNFTVVDNWRFWIVHLWVEAFFELFATVMVAVLFHRLGMVSRTTAVRVIYLDAILFLAGGVVGTGHHWYWTGQSNINMALAACFSDLEVVPLTLLTLDAWDFVKLGHGKCDVCGEQIKNPHKWTFYFLIAVGFWNFVGAGIFGFLINLPIVSYFEVGTMLTPNHGHAAMMGVFGMLGVAFLVFALRQVSSDAGWPRLEKYVKTSFWGLNVGLFLMVLLNLFPGGVLQFADVLRNGYWHARSPAFTDTQRMVLIEWLRLPADVIFIVAGVIPILLATFIAYLGVRRGRRRIGLST
jgi:nitric oxide reductase subunit B